MNLTPRVVRPFQPENFTAAKTGLMTDGEDDAERFTDIGDDGLCFPVRVTACCFDRLILRSDLRRCSRVPSVKDFTSDCFLKDQMRERLDACQCRMTQGRICLCDASQHPVHVTRSDGDKFPVPNAGCEVTGTGVIAA